MNKRGQLIIFGWGKTTQKKLRDVPLEVCSHCHANYVYLMKLRKWFTLFFIPIIPYSVSYYLLCPNCEYGFEIEEDRIEGFLKKIDSAVEKSTKKNKKKK